MNQTAQDAHGKGTFARIVGVILTISHSHMASDISIMNTRSISSLFSYNYICVDEDFPPTPSVNLG